MRKHVTATAGSNDWWVSLTRTAFEIALPKAGDVDPSVLSSLAHRVGAWLLTGWAASASADSLAASVTADETKTLYPMMLKSDHAAGSFPHLPIVVEQAWMQVDKAHEATFMTALGATSLKRVELTELLEAGMIDPHLGALLTAANPANPSRAQLLLALSIAVERSAGMPAAVKTLLTAAAGGKKTATFPAALKVRDLLDGASELDVLRSIGLAPGTAQPKGGGGAVDDDANADLDGDKTNETFVAVTPRIATITGPERATRPRPSAAWLRAGWSSPASRWTRPSRSLARAGRSRRSTWMARSASWMARSRDCFTRLAPPYPGDRLRGRSPLCTRGPDGQQQRERLFDRAARRARGW